MKVCAQRTEYRELHAAVLSTAIAAVFTGLSFPASAIEIDTGNPEISINWNNTVRYNWARRMQDVDPHIAKAGPPPAYSYYSGDALFEKGDTITNRLDLLTELNFAYQGGKYGFRISAAAWYDDAYGDKKPAIASDQVALGTPYQNGEFSDYVKRYYHGPSGEWLDAYVFGNFDVDGHDLNVRLGRHAVVWGEGLIGSNHSVAYSQAPSDSRKSVSSPGASAKETAIPVNQVSATAVLGEEITLLGYYQFEWVPNRIPEGGTYFAPGDPVLWGPDNNRLPEKFRGEHGGYGVGLKWTPEWLRGTLGFYYRKFDDKGGWLAQPTLINFGTTTTASWGRDIKLYGVSLAKSIAGISVGAEVSRRENDVLASAATVSAGPTNRYDGARGDTWHALVNGIYAFGPRKPFFDSAVLLGELTWSRLDKVTYNGPANNLYKAAGSAPDCAGGANAKFRSIRSCVGGDYLGLTLLFSPTWLQVFPGIDLSTPLVYATNFKNAPSFGGGTNGFTTYKASLTATAYALHTFDLSYLWFRQNVDRARPFSGPGGPFGMTYGRVQGPPYEDKGMLSFTYQTTF